MTVPPVGSAPGVLAAFAGIEFAQTDPVASGLGSRRRNRLHTRRRAGVRPTHCRSAVHHPKSSAVRVCRAAALPSAHHPPGGRSADDGKPPCTRVEGKSSSTACGTRPSGEPLSTLAGRWGFSSVRCAVVSLRTVTFRLSRPASDRGSGRRPVRAFRSSPSCRSCLAVPGAGPGLCQGAGAGRRGRGRNEGFRCGPRERWVGVHCTRFPARTGAECPSGQGCDRPVGSRPVFRWLRVVPPNWPVLAFDAAARTPSGEGDRRYRRSGAAPAGVRVRRRTGVRVRHMLWFGSRQGSMIPFRSPPQCRGHTRHLCPGLGMKHSPASGLAAGPCRPSAHRAQGLQDRRSGLPRCAFSSGPRSLRSIRIASAVGRIIGGQGPSGSFPRRRRAVRVR